MMKCPKCGAKMRWTDGDCETLSNGRIMELLHYKCPECSEGGWVKTLYEVVVQNYVSDDE